MVDDGISLRIAQLGKKNPDTLGWYDGVILLMTGVVSVTLPQFVLGVDEPTLRLILGMGFSIYVHETLRKEVLGCYNKGVESHG